MQISRKHEQGSLCLHLLGQSELQLIVGSSRDSKATSQLSLIKTICLKARFTTTEYYLEKKKKLSGLNSGRNCLSNTTELKTTSNSSCQQKTLSDFRGLSNNDLTSAIRCFSQESQESANRLSFKVQYKQRNKKNHTKTYFCRFHHKRKQVMYSLK